MMFKSTVFDVYGNNFSVAITNDDNKMMEALKASVESDHVRELISKGALMGEVFDKLKISRDYASIEFINCSHKVKDILVDINEVVFICETLKSSMGDQLNALMVNFPKDLDIVPRFLYNPNNDTMHFITIDLIGMKNK